MATKLSTILDSLQQQLLLLTELVARVATPPPADDQPRAAVDNELRQLYSDFTVHIAIIQLLLSRSTEDGHASAELDAFIQTLQAGGKTLEALRVAMSPTPSNQATEDKSSPSLTFSHTEMAQQVGQLSVSLRAAMAPLFLSFSPRDSTMNSLPTSNSNSPSTPTLQEAFSRRPFALTGADISPLVPSLDSTELKSTMEAVYAQVNDVAKEWVTKQAATGIAIEPSVLIQLWCGNEWSLLSDMQGQLSPPTSEPAPPKEDVLLVAQAFAGARIRQSTSGRNSIAFIGSRGCGKSSVINAIVGFSLIEAGMPTSVPSRIRHQPGLSEPTLEVAIELFRIGLERLRQFNFTQQCSQWEVNNEDHSIGHSGAPESFRRVWKAWTQRVPSDVGEVLTIMERPDFELAPRTTGLDHVRKMLVYLDAIALFCDIFGFAFDPLYRDWPIISLAFELTPNPQEFSELINLPGYAIAALSDSDFPYFTQLLEEGVIFIPVINLEEDSSETEKVTGRLPELLHRLDTPIPCVIGTYLDAVPRKGIESTRRLTAHMFWRDKNKSNDVFLCSPVGSISAKFVLHYIDNHASKPPSEDVWTKTSDARYWGPRKITFGQDDVKRANYERFSTERVRELMVEYQENSYVIPTLSAYYQAIAASSFREQAAAASTSRLRKVLGETLMSLDAILIDLGSRQDEPPRLPSALGEEFSARTLQDPLEALQTRASAEIKRCLRTAYTELCQFRPVGLDPEQAENEDHRFLLLTSKSLRAILEHCQKAAEPALRSLVADGLAYRSLTETAAGIDERATGVFDLPASPALPIEALSSFQATTLRILLLQHLYQDHLQIRRQTSPWRKIGLLFAVVARAFLGWPLVLLHRRQAYYWISLVELHTRYMDEGVVPWVNEIGRRLSNKSDLRCIAAESTEFVDIESRRGQVERLLALRCNSSAVLAALAQ